MKRKTMALLVGTHLLVAAAGFAAGVYTLPILIAPSAPSSEQVAASQQQARYHGTFRRDLQDSDRLHWGEGKVSIGPDAVSLMGKLAPGPDYQLYLSPEFVETEADFARLKPSDGAGRAGEDLRQLYRAAACHGRSGPLQQRDRLV